MSKSRSFASLAIGGAALLMAYQPASAGVFNNSFFTANPPFPQSVGANTAGPALIIEALSGGAISVHTNPTNSFPYDSVEDTYIGIWNNSGGPLSSIALSSPTLDIFGFDGDGINGSSYLNIPPNASDNSGVIGGGDAYGGPNAYFTGIAGNNRSGTVNFINPIIDQNFDLFSLEGPVTGNDLQSGAGATPLPAALPMFAGGLGAIGGLLWRRKRKARAATA